MEETQHGCDHVISNILCCEQLLPCSPQLAARPSPAAKLALDPRFQVAYANEVFLWKKSLEASYYSTGCLSNQPEITAEMRSKLIQWLAQVNRQFDYTLETLCLTVNYIDRFLTSTPVKPGSLQLIGVAALLVAAKKEEIFPPELKEITRLCGGAYEKSHVRQMEVLLLTTLGFGLCAPTPAYFLDYYTLCANNVGFSEAAKQLVESSLCNYALCQYRPSVIAASAVILTQDFAHNALFIPEVFLCWELEELDRCIFSMTTLVQNWRHSMLYSIPRSFLSPAFAGENRSPSDTAVHEARQSLSRALSLSVPRSLVLQ